MNSFGLNEEPFLTEYDYKNDMYDELKDSIGEYDFEDLGE